MFDSRSELDVLARVDHPASVDQLVLATVGFALVVNHYAASVETSLGAALGRRGGAAYGLSVLPVGLAFAFGADSYVSLTTGIALQGAMGSLDDGVLVPVEATLAVGERSVHVLTRIRGSYAFGRGDGSVLGEQTELSAFAGVEWHIQENATDSGGGPFLGVTYQNWLGAHYVGFALGLAIGTPPVVTR